MGLWGKEPSMERDIEQLLTVLLGASVFVALLCSRRRWRPVGTEFGVAQWASEKMLAAAGMLGGKGLILGRTACGKLIRLPSTTIHALLVAATGAGKGIGLIVEWH